jgi:16S rRNA (guanine527-N7)-methyltransferase
MTEPALDGLIGLLQIQPAQLDRLRAFEALLRKWSSILNLVAPKAFSELWARHILDSAQVQRAQPLAKIWVDMGSGGGFPGIVTAILLADQKASMVHLVESDQRKCAFLRTVSRETGLRTTIHNARIEHISGELPAADAVSARALADMDTLIDWADPLLLRGAVGVFLKGKGARAELTNLTSNSRFIVETYPSLSQADGAIVKVRRSGL